MIDCPHYTRERNHGLCAIGLFGGKPWAGNCRDCIAKGNNNEAFAAKLRETRRRSHPDGVDRISGCCDPIG